MAQNSKVQFFRFPIAKLLCVILFFVTGAFQLRAQIGLPPIITPLIGQPTSQTVVQGSDVQFSVLVTSVTTPSYQWRLNGTNIPGAIASSLSLKNVRPQHAGKYSVVIRNAAGSVTSDEATLVVDASPVRLTSTLLGDGSLKLHIIGPLVATYIVEQSEDCKTWKAISTNLVVAGILDLTLAKSSQPAGKSGFYRVRVR